MFKLEEYAQLVYEMTRESFSRSHDHPFLLLFLAEDEARIEWSFKTTTVASKRLTLAKILDEKGIGLSQAAEQYRIFPLVKTVGSPWRERISIGRARNNDIVLPHKSVSKLHAHFTQTEDGLMALCDAGSRNGTRVNTERVTDGAPTTVRPGDTITLGAVQLSVLDAGGLYDTIRSQLRPEGDESPD